MNWYQFGRLLFSIYGHNQKLPDLAWIQKLGLLAVKLGQVHALRLDFLDPQKCEHLAKLYRQTLSLPPDQFQPLLKRYAPEGWQQHFAGITDRPLASASVSQVHRARLKSGNEVVVKLVKQNLRESFLHDVASVRRLFRLLTFFYPRLKQVGDPVGILNDIEEYTLSELDLTHELEGQTVLREIYETHCRKFNLSKLKFVRVYPELSNQNLLVSDYLSGPTFDELLEKNLLGYERLLDLFHVHGFYIFIMGVFHGDLHPGNIILQDDHLYFIDTGFIGRVGPKIRQGLFAFFEALSEYAYPECAAALNRMSENELTGARYNKFAADFERLYADFTHTTVSQMSLTKQMMRTIKLGVTSGMTFEKGIFSIIRSLMYLDGMVLRCNPDAILLKDMRPFIKEFKRANAALGL